MSNPIGATALLAEFIEDMSTRVLPRPVMEKAAFCLLDSVGLAILAKSEKTVLAANAIASDVDRKGNPKAMAARSWATGRSIALSEAVTANAVAIHAQFHDDTDYSSGTHPASLIVSVALTLGDYLDAPLHDVLRAVLVGYDAIAWLGARWEVAGPLIRRGIRCSPTLGTVAAAATAASLLRLSRKEAHHAVGIASCITGGVLEAVGSGSDEWRLQNAQAARSGMLAAQMAQRGVAGAERGLEGPAGLLRALAGIEEVPALWKEPPPVDAILGVCAKPWATLGDNMAAVMAAELIREIRNTPNEIRKITVRIWDVFVDYPGTSYRGPYERVAQAVASMAFATAAMLVHGDLEYDKSLHHRDDPDILKLVLLVEILPDAKGNAFDGTVTVEFTDGQTITREAAQASQLQLFHDEATAAALLENRLVRMKAAAGTGREIANAVIACARGESDQGTRAQLDRLLAALA